MKIYNKQNLNGWNIRGLLFGAQRPATPSIKSVQAIVYKSESAQKKFDFLIVLIATKSRKYLGAVSIRKMVLPGMAIPMLKIRRPYGRLIFNMEIAMRR